MHGPGAGITSPTRDSQDSDHRKRGPPSGRPQISSTGGGHHVRRPPPIDGLRVDIEEPKRDAADQSPAYCSGSGEGSACVCAESDTPALRVWVWSASAP